MVLNVSRLHLSNTFAISWISIWKSFTLHARVLLVVYYIHMICYRMAAAHISRKSNWVTRLEASKERRRKRQKKHHTCKTCKHEKLLEILFLGYLMHAFKHISYNTSAMLPLCVESVYPFDCMLFTFFHT